MNAADRPFNFEDEIESAIEMTTCLSCSVEGADAVVERGSLRVVRCRGCGLHYLEAWKDELDKAPAHYQYFSGRAAAPLETRVSPANRARMEEVLASFGYPLRRSMLDVGCGEGLFVGIANQLGWRARGIDLSAAAVDLCDATGIPVTRTDFFSSSLDEERFDVIVMSEFLEHVERPARYLARAYELLEPNGLVYLTTPNFGSLSRRVYGADWSVIHPQHVAYFTRDVLGRLIAEHTSFEIIELGARNLSIGGLVAAARGRRKRAGASRAAAPSSAPRRGWALDQTLRARLRGVAAGRLALRAANTLVVPTGLGDSLWALLRKPPFQERRASAAGSLARAPVP